MVSLDDYQLDAVNHLKNGSILCGGVGSGKSRTALAYFYKENHGDLSNPNGNMIWPRDLYIITTAQKRDKGEWEQELAPFSLSVNPEENGYANKVVIDSWNNIKKYLNVKNAFFIFDEQRVVGYGEWSKSFIHITRSNKWILLSATPGDTWMDYIPVFIANRFYKHKTDFIQQHVIYAPRVKFPKVQKYYNTGKLIRLRKEILVDMDYRNKAEKHHIDIFTEFDSNQYKWVKRTQFNPYKSNNGLPEPIQNAGELCYILRHIVNDDPSRYEAVREILLDKKKAVIFYNFDYELDGLRNLLKEMDWIFGEWNGHKHEPVPSGEEWAYLVQYTAGSEGWNCITTDTTIFFSQNYSYRATVQASGRIDRRNTPYTDLYYYHLKSRSDIDFAITRALTQKKNFNIKKYAEGRIFGNGQDSRGQDS